MKERFYKVFANVPIPERSNVIYTSREHGPMSWMVVKLEVDANTELGIDILEALNRMDLI